MRRIILYILAFLFLPIVAQAQIQTIEKLLVKGEYELAYKMIEESYAEDTMNLDRLHSLYSYYIAPNNSQQDSLSAFVYARMYNMGVSNDKKIDLENFAKSYLHLSIRQRALKSSIYM